MKQIFTVVFLMGCLLTPSILHAQSQSVDTTTKGVADLYQKARKQFYDDQFKKARPLLEAIINNAPDHPLTQNAYYLLGLGLKQKKQEPLKAIDYLYRVYEDYDRSNLTDDVLFYLAEIYVEQLNQPRQAVPYLKIIKEDFQEGDFYTPAVDLFNKLVKSDKLDPENVDVTEKPTPGYTLEFKDLTLKRFIEVYASLTGRNIVYDPNVSGEVNVVGGEPIPVDQFFDVFVNILETHGYSVVQREGIYYVETTQEAMQKGVSTNDGLSGLRTQIFRIEGLPSGEVREVIRSLIPRDSKHVILEDLELALVTSKPSSIEEVKKVLVTLKAFKKPAEEKEFLIYHPDYVSAKDLGSKIERALGGTFDPKTFRIIPVETSNILVMVVPTGESDYFKKIAQEFDQDIVDRLNVRVFRLDNADEREVVSQIRNLLEVLPGNFTEKHVRVIYDKRQNAVIVSSVSKKTFQIVEKLILELDKKRIEKPDDIRVFELEQAKVKDVVPLLREIVQILPGDYPEGEIKGNIKILEDRRMNSVVVTAQSKKVFKTINSIIKQLDKEKPDPPDRVNVYSVKNTEAKIIAEQLDGIYGGVVDVNGKEISISANEETNNLVISSTPKMYPRIKKTIDKLDTRKEQVLVDVFIAEASQDKVKQLGIEWGSVGEATISNSKRKAQIGTNFGLKQRFAEGTLFGLNAGTFDESGENLLNLIHAFEEDEDFKILSTAHLMANENKKASLVVGEVIPLLQSAQTTEGGALNRSFNFEDVGVELEIVPVVGENDVTLDITQRIENISSSGEELGAASRTKREIKTNVGVPDGVTLVLGGVISTQINKGEQRVPYLGNIPILENFFKSTNQNVQRENLLVFLTPHILKTTEDLKEKTEDLKEKQADQKN